LVFMELKGKAHLKINIACDIRSREGRLLALGSEMNFVAATESPHLL
jgi:hypothetical protein